MTKRMLINVKEPEESRIAIMEGDKLEEIYIERSSSLGHIGNIYKGIVVNIEPSIQAAFVDIGEGRNGFLHVSDVMPIYGQMNETDNPKNRKKEKKIQDLLVNGMEVLIEITKEGIGNKAPTLTTYLSIPGRYVVLMPSIKRSGVSKKIGDENLRRKLKNTLEELAPPPGMGYIIRTAGANRTKKEISRDLDYLLNLWKVITKRAKHAKSPSLIYQESDLVIRTLRDIFTDEIEEIIIDSQIAYQRALDFMSVLSPDYERCVQFYDENIPLFHKYGVENEIEKIYQKKVPLRSGGHLVIEQTEAIVAVDVNSGKYTDEVDIEETAFKINMEAAEEIARQLRLRDLGGLIINDFIDMRDNKNKRAVERTFRDAVRKDRARSRVGRISQFGIIEMTRQRLGPSIKNYTHNICSHCNGQGWIKSIESMSLMIMRKIKLGALTGKVRKIIVTTSPEVTLDLANRKRKVLHIIEEQTGTEIIINPSNLLLIEKFTVEYFDENNQLIQNI
ncbi:MAG: Rne/Rng family ribonuclease [Planctomycetes bacterium]|jgi:ribonuclease E|nr:Rne/Rng family ribonuclease [Planctomycetota bacterium]